MFLEPHFLDVWHLAGIAFVQRPVISQGNKFLLWEMFVVALGESFISTHPIKNWHEHSRVHVP